MSSPIPNRILVFCRRLLRPKAVFAGACVVTLIGSGIPAAAKSTAFGYQGVLEEAGEPANGFHDFRFTLFDAEVAGNPISMTATNYFVLVDQGHFNTLIDLGIDAATNEVSWLEIEVRPAGGEAFTALEPRQPLRPVPSALYSLSAARAEFALSAAQAAAVEPLFWQRSQDIAAIVQGINANAGTNRWSPSLLPLRAGQNVALTTAADAEGGSGVVTLSVTNVVSSLRTPNLLWVDATEGDDATAERGREDRPFRSLAAAVAQLTNSCTVRLRPGIYSVAPGPQSDEVPYNAAVVIQDRCDIAFIGDGPGVTIQAIAEGNVFLIRNTTNVLFQDLTVRGVVRDGSSEDQRYYALLLCDGSNRRLRVAQCAFLDSGNQAIAHLYGPRTTYDWDISHNYFENIGSTNSTLLGSDGAAIAIGGGDAIASANRMHNVLRGIEIEGSAPGDAKHRIQILGNTITGIWHGVDDGGYGIAVIGNSADGDGNIAEISIEGNLIDAAPESPSWLTGGIVVGGGTHIAVRNNTVRRCGAGISLFSSTLPLTRGMVSGNVVVESVLRGIQITSMGDQISQGFLVSGNLVSGGGNNGIELTGLQHSAIGNHVIGNYGAGIRVYAQPNQFTADVYLANNYCAQNSTAGIIVEAEARNTILGQNMLVQNGIESFGFVTNLIDRSSGPGVIKPLPTDPGRDPSTRDEPRRDPTP